MRPCGLISDETAQFAQYALSQRIPRKYTQQRQAENAVMPEDAPTKTSVYGASLLSGLLYCAHCGKKLVGGYCTKAEKKRRVSSSHLPLLQRQRKGQAMRRAGGLLSGENRIRRA